MGACNHKNIKRNLSYSNHSSKNSWNQNPDCLSNLEKYMFFRNIKEEFNIKIISTHIGEMQLKYKLKWEKALKDTNKLWSHCNISKVNSDSQLTSEINTGVDFYSNNLNNNDRTCNFRLPVFAKLTSLVELLYRENPKKLSELIDIGIPNNLRWITWYAIAKSKFNINDVVNLYYELLSMPLREDLSQQIVKDLDRTAPEVNFFKTDLGKKSLFNVLKALAIFNKDVGYVQGINILTANVLLVSDGNECESFHFICYLFSEGPKGLNLKNFYARGFPQLHIFIYITKILINEQLANLYGKITEIIAPYHDEIWIFKWLQSLYSLTIDFSIGVRLWDFIIFNGLNFIYYFTLAFLKNFENEILICEDMVEFVNIFKTNMIINNKNTTVSTIEPILTFREKLISSSLIYRNKINEAHINELVKKYHNDPEVVNQYLLNDSYVSGKFSNKQIDIVSRVSIKNDDLSQFSFQIYQENVPQNMNNIN